MFTKHRAPSLNYVSMLLWSAWYTGDSVALKVMECFLRVECGLAVDDELAHGTVLSDPALVDNGYKRWCELVLDEVARMPADTPADKMADDKLVYEKQVALHLVVESARDLQ